MYLSIIPEKRSVMTGRAKVVLSPFAREVVKMNFGFANIYWRDMIRFVRFRTMLISSLLQPALWLAFFGIAMSSSFDSLMIGIPVPPGFHTVGYLTFMADRDHCDDHAVHEPLWGNDHPL